MTRPASTARPIRAPITIPQGLRQLREAIAWARATSQVADDWVEDATPLTEHQPMPGVFVASGITATGGGLAITITDDRLHLLRSEAHGSADLFLPLPGRLRVIVPPLPSPKRI